MNIYEVLMPIAVLGSMSVGAVFFTKTLTDYFLRKKMVEKGYVNPENDVLLKKHSNANKLSSLKWGLLILSAGIGLVIIDGVSFKDESTLPFGIFAISVSLGFLVYFVLARRMSDEINK
ncbi:MAG: DUF6249 domain-containing protein [Fulvivirga sp.]|uniref:DUF6249 domain-containing protein n=1 Tax=Fulvivirga sp. TaxID=1931237 RepID=UPI0032F0490E